MGDGQIGLQVLVLLAGLTVAPQHVCRAQGCYKKFEKIGLKLEDKAQLLHFMHTFLCCKVHSKWIKWLFAFLNKKSTEIFNFKSIQRPNSVVHGSPLIALIA